MRFKKMVSKSLAAILFLNTGMTSFAGTLSEGGRYETLEGERVTIEGSTRGKLHEIEVFGNTVQNENNLEDIQSVGDLYVDENGKPILDSQGREQYAIKISSKNLSPITEGLITWINAEDGSQGDTILKDRVGNNDFILKNFIYDDTDGFIDGRLKINGYGMEYGKNVVHALEKFTTPCKSFVITVEKTANTSPWYIFDGRGLEGEGSSGNYAYNGVAGFSYDTSKTRINGVLRNDTANIGIGEKVSIYFELKEPEMFAMSIMCRYSLNEAMDGYFYSLAAYDRALTEDEILYNCAMEGTITANATTILLPTQLQKVGNISDRLYWDNSKGRYLIEKNITSITLDGSSDENWVLSRGQHSDVYDHFRVIPHMFGEEEGVSGHGNALLSNRFLCTNRSWEEGPHNSITTSSSQYTQIGMTFDMYYYQTLDGFKDWLKDNPTIVWYQLKTPKIIETDITSKIQILTYDNKTYIYTEAENGVSPTIKITVDRINKLSREAVEKAETEPTSTNISLARMWVNQMDESFLKDQLQERLNLISGINDLEIDRKTVTANLDVYIKSDNALSMSLSTNSVTFEGYSGIDDLEKLNAVDVIVSSSLPYDLNAYLEESLQNSDKTSIMSPSTINIRQNGSIDYNQFTNTTDKVILNDNCNVGNNNVHSIDLKLSSDDTHKADVYKAVIKFEAVQK